MSLLNLEEDAINKAMVEGLKTQFKIELKEELMKPVNEALKTAEEKVDVVVNNLCDRINLIGASGFEYELGSKGKRHFRLEWIITKNVEHFIKNA